MSSSPVKEPTVKAIITGKTIRWRQLHEVCAAKQKDVKLGMVVGPKG